MKLYAKLLGLGKGMKKIEWILPYAKNMKVLDLGCAGEGENAFLEDNWLHGQLIGVATKCFGVDNNLAAITILKSKGYDVINADVQFFSLNEKFDVIVAGDIIEHLEDLKGFFHSINNLLEDNGYLLITTPNPWFFFRFIRCFLKGEGGVNPGHVHWFCSATIRELLDRFGFEVENLEFGSSEPFFYYLFFLPRVLRHTSLFVAARKKIYN